MCHSVCEDYKAFTVQVEEERHKRLLDNDSRFGMAKRPQDRFRWSDRNEGKGQW